jgi:ubiquinone biosynthesis monooxygenase Coq7
LPGDLDAACAVARILRVDHAGEYGAVRIYEGQMAVLGRKRDPGTREAARRVAAMAAQERAHLATFERLLPARRVRPTALLPLWHVAGFALGAATALMGPRAAMACTIAVEETIDRHYADQRDRLGADEALLSATIERFRHEELEHRDVAEAAGGREAPGFSPLAAAIRLGSRCAIWLSERV